MHYVFIITLWLTNPEVSMSYLNVHTDYKCLRVDSDAPMLRRLFGHLVSMVFLMKKIAKQN